MTHQTKSSTLIGSQRFPSIAQMQQAQVDWVTSAPANVFGTLKFYKALDYERPPTEILFRHASLFWNKMDRLYYANRAEKGVRISRHCFLHMGSSRANPHLHFVADVDGNVDYFCKLAAVVWSSLSDKTTSKAETWIQPVRDLKASSIYMTREEFCLAGNSYQPELSHCRHEGPARDFLDMNKLEERLLQQMQKLSI